MKTKYLIAIPALFLAAQSFAHKVDVSPDVHHRNSDIKYDHAEQLNYNGIQCIAVFLGSSLFQVGDLARTSPAMR
jgi:hypothetical protein